MTENESQPMCKREFLDDQTGKKVIALLGSPVYDHNQGGYYCSTEILGIDGGKKQKICADDQFEALMLALLRFRVMFAKQKSDLRTENGSAPYMVFPREIPWVHGADIYQKLCRLVDEEVQKMEDERSHRRERRGRKE